MARPKKSSKSKIDPEDYEIWHDSIGVMHLLPPRGTRGGSDVKDTADKDEEKNAPRRSTKSRKGKKRERTAMKKKEKTGAERAD